MDEIFDKYQELARAFLAKKERVNYYEAQVYDESDDDLYGFHDDTFNILVDLSDDEVAKLRDLKGRYGEDFVSYLNEVFEDKDDIYDLFSGEPVDIDLENAYHKYRFIISEVDGDKVKSHNISIQLSDEEYRMLLVWHLFDSHLSINTLFFRDEKLAKKIMLEAMRCECHNGTVNVDHPFVIVMDEALSDVEQILKENGLRKGEGYPALFI